METTVRRLHGYTVRGTDGDAGTLSDILFDDADWRLRYVVADTGDWVHRRRVLLTVASLARIEPAAHAVRVALTRDQVRHAPSFEADPPVFFRMEHRFRDALVLVGAWVAGFNEPYTAHALVIWTPDGGLMPVHEDDGGDPHLRSAVHMLGDHVMARDAPAGSLEDFVVESDGWTIKDIVVRTHGWPHHRSVLVSPYWVGRVSWATCSVFVDLPRSRIEHAGVSGLPA